MRADHIPAQLRHRQQFSGTAVLLLARSRTDGRQDMRVAEIAESSVITGVGAIRLRVPQPGLPDGLRQVVTTKFRRLIMRTWRIG